MKFGSGNWRLSEKVGKESGRLELLVDVGAAHTPTQVTIWAKSGKETATDDSISPQAPLTGRLTGRRDYLFTMGALNDGPNCLYPIIFAVTVCWEIKTLGCDTCNFGCQNPHTNQDRSQVVAPHGMQLKLLSFWPPAHARASCQSGPRCSEICGRKIGPNHA